MRSIWWRNGLVRSADTPITNCGSLRWNEPIAAQRVGEGAPIESLSPNSDAGGRKAESEGARRTVKARKDPSFTRQLSFG
jgi:hypothetical protein